MSRLALTAEHLTRLRRELLAGDVESCAVLFGRSVVTEEALCRIVIRESMLAPPEAYLIRSPLRAVLRPEFVASVIKRVRLSKESVTFVHTHNIPLNNFSEIDDAGEVALADVLRRRAPAARHAALLLTAESSVARELGTQKGLQVIGVGPTVALSRREAKGAGLKHDRQILAFGQQGQEILQSMRVAVVGLGGTGSLMVQSLVHLGVRDLLLVDFDIADPTNLNRLVGASDRDVGNAKVEIAKRFAMSIDRNVRIAACRADILHRQTSAMLFDTDFIFCCTDSQASRAVINQISYQYLIPAIDMGVVIRTINGRVDAIAARTQMLAPGLACLVCGNFLDYEQVRRDFLSDSERRADPYIVGDHQPAPSVITLNSTIASLAATMFLNAVTGIPGSARLLSYNAISGSVRPASCTPHPACIVCSRSGALAKAGEWELPGRLS